MAGPRLSVAASLAADPQTVRSHLAKLHACAASAFEGSHQAGMMQLVRIHPGTEDTLAFQFAIGEVDLMAAEAVRQANAGFNVYVEGRTVRQGVRKRGRLEDTVGVFALTIDADADKGKAGSLGIQPTFVIETSPGNYHYGLALDHALPVEQAQALGAAIRFKVGADAATGVLTQPYRVAGTPNFPGKRKIARGRVATPTSIVNLDGRIWSVAELREAFPEPKRRADFKRDNVNLDPDGTGEQASATVEAIVAETDAPDRSERFFDAIRAALAEGLTADAVEAAMRRHPEGCASKYLEPYDRLRREIDRAWEKVEDRLADIRRDADTATYADGGGSVEDARVAVVEAVRRFLEASDSYHAASAEEVEPPVHALAVTTGVGKTWTTAAALAEHIRTRPGNLRKSILYVVPTHRLGSEIERQFIAHGVTARVFRGRQADDPNRSGASMCLDLEGVEIALALGEPVSTSCCRNKPKGQPERMCDHYYECGYQTQLAPRPDVWIIAHQLLFQAQAALGEAELVIVDEGFWQAGLRIPKRGLTLNEIEAPLPLGRAREDALHADVEAFRHRLASGLRAQDAAAAIGGARKEHLARAGVTAERCTEAISAEWALKGKATIYPGMPRLERRAAAAAAKHAKHTRGFVGLWNAARDLLSRDDVEVSGRLYLEYKDDADGRVLLAKARGLRAIAKSWQVPTLILDATLPAPEILKAFYPQMEEPIAIEAAMPHVRVRQVLAAPVAARKLKPEEGQASNRNLRAIRREILRRFIELGRLPTLVIAQQAAADWLRASSLPAGIAVEHFNNIAGLDRYGHVRGLMVIGRTLPSPSAVEALAGAITGVAPTLIPDGEWYAKSVRGIRTAGDPVGIETESHPDPVAEACRWQICEGEMIQAFGRGRGVNRTAETPLDIDILANVCLPVTVNEVAQWSPPCEAVEMAADGVILDSGADMALAWPSVWPSADAARKWASRRAVDPRHSVTEPYRDLSYIGIRHAVVPFRYQRPGERQKWRTGAYDPATVPDIRAWLTQRLGEIAGFEAGEP